MLNSIFRSLALSSIIMVAGCHPAGPSSVRTGRASYNMVIQQTNNEQLLLNLVRLRYRDTPYFLEVSSVSTTFDITASAAGILSLPESESKTYELGTGISFSEQPTVSYTPLQGEGFVTQLMSPIDLNTINLLYHSGWSVERIFRICLQSINNLKNAPSASGPTPDYVPKYKRFREVVDILRRLQLQGVLDMGHVRSDDPNSPQIEIRISHDVLDSEQVRRLLDLLGLGRGGSRFRLTTEVGTGGKDQIAVVPRSLMGSLFYISQSVEVPPSDELDGLVTVTRDAQGQPFDWSAVTGGLMTIYSSEHLPENACVTVSYRGHWFYIMDSDLTSKSTFSLLSQLFALQAGEVKSTTPILTLPVGR